MYRSNETDEQAIKRILKAEAQKEVLARLRSIMKKEHMGALSHLLIEENGRFRSIHDQDEINILLTRRNAQHFSQADGTPFTIPTLASIFGKYGTNENSRLLLNGELQINNIATTEATKTLLGALKRVTPEGTVSSHISAEAVRLGYKKWRESTSTSPSGLHLGHDKAITRFKERDRESKLDKLLSKRFLKTRQRCSTSQLNMAMSTADGRKQ